MGQVPNSRDGMGQTVCQEHQKFNRQAVIDGYQQITSGGQRARTVLVNNHHGVNHDCRFVRKVSLVRIEEMG